MPAEVRTAPGDVQDLLHRWFARQVDEKALAWLTKRRKQIAEGAPDSTFFAAFSAVPRYTGKQNLRLTEEDVHAAGATRTDWNLWSVDQAARSLLLLSLSSDDAQVFVTRLEKLATCADLGELVALYQTLPLLPHSERLCALAAEGARTNMKAVFDAVALHNAYPAEYFDRAAWNQMVLKALFIESPLHLIYGLDRRANPVLARMLSDYAHERWAAKRVVSPELWRPVGRYASDEIVADLEKVLKNPDPMQQCAAALALSQSTSRRAAASLAGRADLQAAIADGRLNWTTFAQSPVAKDS